MDVQDLVVGVRWELLQRLTASPATGADLARALNTSAANISQHLKLLELGGLVAKERVSGKSTHYKLARRMALVTMLDAPASRAIVALDPVRMAELRLLLENKAENNALRAFLASKHELVKTFSAFGIIAHKASHSEVQLLVIAEDLKALRKEYANFELGGTKFVIWSHTAAEFAEGLGRKDHYFTEKLRDVSPIVDPDGLFLHWKGVQK